MIKKAKFKKNQEVRLMFKSDKLIVLGVKRNELNTCYRYRLQDVLTKKFHYEI